MLPSLARDVRNAGRVLRRGWRFFLLLWLVLSGGIGAATATFSIARTVLQSPLPFPDSDRLVTVWTARAGNDQMMVSMQELLHWQARSRSFEHLAMSVGWMFSIASPDAPTEGIVGIHVSGDFFAVLAARPLLGRLIEPEDDRLGAERVAVLAESVWRRRFGGNASVIGSRIELDSQPYVVVGIVPDAFRFSYPGNEPVYVWTPMAVSFPYYATQLTSPVQRDKHVSGRLAPGVGIAQAQRELATLSAQERLGGPGVDGSDVRVVPLRQDLVGPARRPLLLAASAVALLLLVVCCNVTSLLLTRTQSRRAELALRAALGATRGRLIQQLSLEVVVLFLLAAPAGAVIARAFLQLFYQLVLGSNVGARANGVYEIVPAFALVQLERVQLDASALLFGMGLSLGLGLLAAVVPALGGSRGDLRTALEQAGARAPARSSQTAFRAAMLTGQVALTFALSLGSGTALLSLARLSRTSLGFEPTNVLAFRFLGSAKHYSDLQQLAQVYAQVMQRLRERPDVRAVALSSTIPLSGDEGRVYLDILDRTRQPTGAAVWGVANSVSAGFFQTMQIPLLAGRDLDPDDLRRGSHVALINESLAKQRFGGQDPLGHFVRPRQSYTRPLQVIGVVGDVLRDGIARPPVPEIYMPLGQLFDDQDYILVRADQPEQLFAELPALVAALDPTLGVWGWSMTEGAREPLRYRGIVTAIASTFALAALCLAVLGISGLVAHETSRRTREIGIRLALGSPARSVIWLVMRDTLAWISAGLALGLGGVWLLGRTLSERLLLGIQADAGLYLGVAFAIAAVALVAALLPALGALRTPPLLALKRD